MWQSTSWWVSSGLLIAVQIRESERKTELKRESLCSTTPSPLLQWRCEKLSFPPMGTVFLRDALVPLSESPNTHEMCKRSNIMLLSKCSRSSMAPNPKCPKGARTRSFLYSFSPSLATPARHPAIRARSGSTLKDQYLGELPGIEKERNRARARTQHRPEHNACPNTFRPTISQHLTSKLHGSKRSNTIGGDLPKCHERGTLKKWSSNNTV